MAKLEADWLTAGETQRAFAMLVDAGHQVFAVGGCVRDALFGRPVSDIDLSTNALPDAVITIARNAGFRAIPTGIGHGTVTVVIGEMAFEITTFRQDVETDGRRAVVKFSNEIEDDARRRDFTMNALYCDASGEILDPLGGLNDLKARRVRFIEDADTRIREDFLRSIRYFRFFAWYGDNDQGMDLDALDAIARNTVGLRSLSQERLGAEMLRLLSAFDPAPAVAGMRSAGVLAEILPGSEIVALALLVELEQDASVEADPIRRLAVMGGEDVVGRLRLSRKEGERLTILRRSAELSPAEMGYRLGWEIGRDVLLVREASIAARIDYSNLVKIWHGSMQRFPVHASDLMPALEGPKLGAALKRLEAAWISSGFVLSREELLALEG